MEGVYKRAENNIASAGLIGRGDLMRKKRDCFVSLAMTILCVYYLDGPSGIEAFIFRAVLPKRKRYLFLARQF